MAGWPDAVAILLIVVGGAGVFLDMAWWGALAVFAGFSIAFRRYLNGVVHPRQTDSSDDEVPWL